MFEVILTDSSNQKMVQKFDNDLKAASQCLLDAWTNKSHKDGEMRRNGLVLIQFGF